MEKAVIGATKPKCMYPKQKYLDSLLFGATSSMNNIMLIMNALQPRMSSNTWTTSFKSLLVVHLLTRSDAGNDVLSYCASQRGILSAAYKGGANSGHSSAIRSYAAYLIEKVHVYGELQRDLVRTGVQGRDGYLRNLPLSKGLLHHVAALQKQIGALVSCKFYMDELSNEVTVGAFALLVQDLLRLFQAMNEGVINILQHYFEMTKDQARLGLQIYKTFAEQTTKVMDYFSVAKRMETVIHITIPQLKHAPLSLVRTLEEYLNSPDFEETQGKTKTKEVSSSKSTTKPPSSSAKPSSSTNNNNNSGKNDADTWAPKKTVEESKRLSTKKDMIDFFSSIDNEETPIAQNPNMFQAQMMTGGDEFQQFQLQLQQQNQLLQMQQMQQMQQQQMLQNQMTGFGGQNFQPNMVTAQPTGFNTNPFTMQQQQSQADMFGGSSMNLLGGGMGNVIGNGSMGNMSSVLPQSTGNPFRTNSSIGSMSAPSQPQMTGATHYNTMPSLSSQPTGTNPFAPSANPLNPFSPNFGKVPAQPTGMAGMNNNNNNNNMNMGMGVNGGMMVNNNQTGANNPWGQHQQSAFGHQASGSSFM
ncbi:MAG: ANTH domain-containing protein [Podila humilis]|nr:MAG: ANTH domain-containing protein [Podila humilis]